MARIGWTGLGVMGWPMAAHLARAGHELAVFARRPERAQAFAARHGGRVCASAAEAAAGADAFIACVSADADVEALALGEAGALAALPAGTLFVDHSTVSPALARRLAGHCPGLLVVDAPVSGGEAGARAGTLSVMAGGSEPAVGAARPMLAAYAARVTRIGPPGHGQSAKLANQMAIAGVLQGLAEAVAFARAAGLDGEATLDALSGGAAQSWQMVHRWRTMWEGAFDFGFAVELMRKDLGLALAAARETGTAAPLTALVDQFYAEVEGRGGARWDTSSLVARQARP